MRVGWCIKTEEAYITSTLTSHNHRTYHIPQSFSKAYNASLFCGCSESSIIDCFRNNSLNLLHEKRAAGCSPKSNNTPFIFTFHRGLVNSHFQMSESIFLIIILSFAILIIKLFISKRLLSYITGKIQTIHSPCSNKKP